MAQRLAFGDCFPSGKGILLGLMKDDTKACFWVIRQLKTKMATNPPRLLVKTEKNIFKKYYPLQDKMCSKILFYINYWWISLYSNNEYVRLKIYRYTPCATEELYWSKEGNTLKIMDNMFIFRDCRYMNLNH